jgi:hypothetical protein
VLRIFTSVDFPAPFGPEDHIYVPGEREMKRRPALGLIRRSWCGKPSAHPQLQLHLSCWLVFEFLDHFDANYAKLHFTLLTNYNYSYSIVWTHRRRQMPYLGRVTILVLFVLLIAAGCKLTQTNSNPSSRTSSPPASRTSDDIIKSESGVAKGSLLPAKQTFRAKCFSTRSQPPI